LAAGCGRSPTEPAGGRAPVRIASTSVTDGGHVQSAVVMVTRTDEADSVANEHDSQVLDEIPGLSLVLMRTPPGQTTGAFVEKLRGDGRVVHSEPDDMVQTAEARQSTVAFCEATRTWSDVVDQTALARVGVAVAQSFGQGEGAIVAIVDTGIDLDHPALA